MARILEFVFRHKYYFFVSILVCYATTYFFLNRAYVDLDIDVARKTHFSIYYASTGQPFNEGDKVKYYVKPGVKKYRFFLSNMRDVERLRIDTHQYYGDATIKRLVINQLGMNPVKLLTENEFSKLKPLHHIKRLEFTQKGFVVTAYGKDPYLEWQPTIIFNSVHPAIYASTYLAIFAILWLVFAGVGVLEKEFGYVPLLLSCVLCFVIVLAATTRVGYHPDERVHINGAKYYEDNWIPPTIENPDIQHTYSSYGFSRLHSGEVYYLFAGKFAKLIEPLRIQKDLPYRVFNVLLLGFIVLYTIRVPASRLIGLALLISPQLWYVFGYCNSDAYAVCMIFFMGCQLVVQNSFLNRLLRSEELRKQAVGIMLLGLGFGLMFLLKKNYYPFIVAIGIVLAVDWLRLADQEKRKEQIKRLALVLGIALSVLVLHKAVDISVFGLDKQDKVLAAAAERAKPMFNLTTPVNKRFEYLTMQQRGVSFNRMVHHYRWFEKTFRSSFGVYGHFTISAQESYYNFMRYVGLGLVVFLTGSILLRASWLSKGEMLALLTMSLALIGVSFHMSWTSDFQAQGRYLFPVAFMLSLVYARNRTLVSRRIVNCFIVLMFSASTYSFVWIGLKQMP